MKKLMTISIFILLTIFVGAQNWEYSHYIDEFGDKTNNDFIFLFIEGNFSNVATSGSKLGVNILVSLDHIAFKLYEYLDGPPVGKQIGDCTYELFMKIEKNNALFGGIKYYSLTSAVAIIATSGNDDFDDYKSFINILKKSMNPIKCYINIKSEYGTSSKYNFIINPIGFTKAYKKL